jgi:hypothetical protein
VLIVPRAGPNYRCALDEDALQGAAMHVQSRRGFRNVHRCADVPAGDAIGDIGSDLPVPADIWYWPVLAPSLIFLVA